MTSACPLRTLARVPGLRTEGPTSFLLATPEGSWSAGGAVDHVDPDVGRPLEERVREVLDRAPLSERNPRVVGALPYRRDGAVRLHRPEWIRHLSREGGGAPRFPSFGVEGIEAAASGREGSGSAWRVREDPSRSEYEAMVERALRLLVVGEGGAEGRDTLEKVVLARRLLLESDRPLDPAAILERLHEDRSVTLFALPLPADEEEGEGEGRGSLLLGATPELLLSRKGRTVLSHPLAGSMPRSADPAEDRRRGEELLHSEKDLREHAAVVAWIVERLASLTGKLTVPPRPSLVATRSMWHLGTRIEGELPDFSVSSIALAELLHPTPAVCGTPFDAAVSAIERLESFDRGFFTGTVGWCDSHGNGEWYVTIRCARLEGRKATLYAGAGIVSGSDPGAESRETGAKFRALLEALDAGSAIPEEDAG